MMYDEGEKNQFKEIVVEVKRTAKKTKGGDRLAFSALSVVGDQAGQVGMGLGKAPDVRAAVKKSTRKAKKDFFVVTLIGEAKTIPHEVRGFSGACEVLLKPAPSGTGIRAGGAIRSVLEVAGVQNVVAKMLGSRNKKGNIDATLAALMALKDETARKYKRKKRD